MNAPVSGESTAVPSFCAECLGEIDMAAGAVLIGKRLYHHRCYALPDPAPASGVVEELAVRLEGFAGDVPSRSYMRDAAALLRSQAAGIARKDEEIARLKQRGAHGAISDVVAGLRDDQLRPFLRGTLVDLDNSEAQLATLLREKGQLEDVLRSGGFRRCDIPACNCGSWHQVDGFAARFREIEEAVSDAGYSTNGRVLLAVVKDVIAASLRAGKEQG